IMLQVGPRIIAASPLVGFGSWGVSPEIAAIVKEAYAESDDPVTKSYAVSGSVLAIHSQVLPAWVGGGILAGAFFVLYIILATKAAVRVSLIRPWDNLSSPLLAILLNGLWHALMSPFVATHRLDIAMALAAITLVQTERAQPVTTPVLRSTRPQSIST